MGDKKKQSLSIQTKKEEDISKWYVEVIQKSDMADYTKVSGCIVYKPNSYQVWEKIKEYFDNLIKEDGVKNCYFPLFIPKSLLTKEEEHIEDFAPEVAWVDYGGNTKLNERLAIRPTSETIFYDSYSKWIKSSKDLPLRLNQWCNIVRWEFKHATPFLRGREFLWQEGHTAFESEDEAVCEVFKILNFYRKVAEDLLALPISIGKKSINEKFAGAVFSTTIEGFMPDRKSIQAGTSHYLGQNFSKAFDIKFEKKDKFNFVHQNSWGISTRLIGALILTHSDNSGLVLPPKVCINKVVIVPLFFKGKEDIVLKKAKEIFEELKQKKLNPILDEDREESAGFRFNKWEIQGMPIRIEIGPKDIEKNCVILVRRDIQKKIEINLEKNNLSKLIFNELEEMQKNLFEKAKKLRDENICFCKNLCEFEKGVEEKKLILAPWFESCESEEKIKEKYGVKTSCIPINFNKKIFENYELPNDLKNFDEKNLEKYNCFFDKEKKASCFVYFSKSH